MFFFKNGAEMTKELSMKWHIIEIIVYNWRYNITLNIPMMEQILWIE